MENNFKVGYRQEERIFEVKFFGKINEQTVFNCRQAQLECFQKYFDGNEYKFLLDTRGYEPQSEEAHRLIRTVVCSKDNKEIANKCVPAAAVNDSVSKIANKRATNTESREQFFTNIDKALDWLARF